MCVMFRLSSHAESSSADSGLESETITNISLTPALPSSLISDVDRRAGCQKEMWRLKKMLYIASIGLFFNISAYYGLVNLQSSLNIRDGLGTTGLAIGYVSSLVWALLLTPLAIDNLGPKNAMVVSEVTYVIYCLANFYPNYFTLIPGAIVLGFGEACCWASMSVIVTYYGEQYWSLAAFSISNPGNNREKTLPNLEEVTIDEIYGGHNRFNDTRWGDYTSPQIDIKKNRDAYVSKFFSKYFSIIKTSQIVGNLLSYVALYAGVVVHDNAGGGDGTHGNESHANASTVGNVTFDLSLCGINDCVANFQMASPDMLSRYLAKNEMSVSVLLAVFAVMHAIAIAMHFFLLDPIPKWRPSYSANGTEIFRVNVIKEFGFWKRTFCTLAALFRQMFSLQQILVSPIALYFGLFLSYSLSEFTRAFVSCTMGVETVGLVMMLFGASSMCAAFLLGKVVPRFGRNPLYLLASVLDLACYGSNFIWAPSSDETLPVYFMAIGFGFNAGLWEPLINSTYAHYFSDNTSAAFSLWNFWGAAGLCVGFSLSTTVCLAVKLYILISLLSISIVCYVCAEIRFLQLAKVNPAMAHENTD